VAAAIVILIVLPIINNPAYDDPEYFVDWVYTAAIVIGVISAVVVAAFIYLRRDLAGLWVAGAGVVTGIVAAFVSAPIAAIAFEGVTGSGADLIVAALRQGGADVFQASLGQGLFSDPIDKTITSFVVFIILTSISPRVIARFPNGERLTGEQPD
jgi:energy-coupling factor transport system substrate-specific component